MKIIERVIFKAKAINKMNSNPIYVKGSGFYQNDKGHAFIYGYDNKKKFHKVEIMISTLKVYHYFEED